MKVVDQVRARKEAGKNYFAVYANREVVRFVPDESRDIESTTIPEFMDIKLTDDCNGNCPYCYQNSCENGNHAENPIGRLESYFAGVEDRDMPFQVALGGGDPLRHPQITEILEWFASRGVVPNLTTNGLNFNLAKLHAIDDYCGGVAITAHPHLDTEWRLGFSSMEGFCAAPAIHVMYHDAASLEYIRKIVDVYSKRAYAIVMLPLISQGRASDMDATIDRIALDGFVSSLTDEELKKVAWGAMSYPYITNHPRLVENLSLYEPEQFSRYLDLTTMREYASSFAVPELQA
jgi:hypothetical protein